MVDGLLGFNNTLANNPTASELAEGLAAAVRNGTVKLSVDPTTIVVTVPSAGAGQYTFIPMFCAMIYTQFLYKCDSTK